MTPLSRTKRPEDVRPLAWKIGAADIDIRDAVSGADAVIVLLPLPGIAKLPTDLLDDLAPQAPAIGTSD
jgi:hypothetical protein